MHKCEIVPLRICETDKFDEGQPLHACLPFGESNQTLCGFIIETKTHIPLSSWGHSERLWCYRCQLAIRNHGHNIPEVKKRNKGEAKPPQNPEPNVVYVLPPELLIKVGNPLKNGFVRDFCRRCADELSVEDTGGNYCE